MARSLTLQLSPHKDGGLQLSVTQTNVTGDNENKLTVSERTTDVWGGDASAAQAVQTAVQKYFGLLRTDASTAFAETPIGAAAAGEP